MEQVGLYIHIPFCKSRCRYCDFYSTTQLDKRERYVEAVVKELEAYGSNSLSTIYFGGGTPSLLSVEQIQKILRPLALSTKCEITLEANPGDLSLSKSTALRKIGINRLSIGIQSLDDELLRRIGRRHTAAEAVEAVRMAREAGFTNLSIDLMYGLPGQTMAQWEDTIDRALQLHAEHISCYCLSYEEGTVLTCMLERGEITETDEDTENAMYDLLCEKLKAAGYTHYEVSNFALPGYHSRHNSGYWNNTPYIGLGAGAHSYDGHTRRWNVSDIDAYIHGIATGQPVCQEEVLTDEQRHIEAVMLSLRTAAGIPAEWLTDKTTKQQAQAYVAKGLLREADGRYIATQQGLHILNRIIQDLIE